MSSLSSAVRTNESESEDAPVCCHDEDGEVVVSADMVDNVESLFTSSFEIASSSSDVDAISFALDLVAHVGDCDDAFDAPTLTRLRRPHGLSLESPP